MPAATRDETDSAKSRTSHRRGAFATTRWSIVLQARDVGSAAGDALAHLCRTYWFPLYAHVRRRGYSAHDAEDLTQEFFARLLAHRTLARADPARGRFRSFVLTALKHFLADEWDKIKTQKRGGGRRLVSFDAELAERRLQAEPADAASSPDKAFDRQWAVVLLGEVLLQLETEYRAAGKARLFAALKSTLTGARDTQPYVELAASLGTTEGAVKIAVHRLRRRYRELLEAEIAHTVATPEEAAAELNDLFRALAER